VEPDVRQSAIRSRYGDDALTTGDKRYEKSVTAAIALGSWPAVAATSTPATNIEIIFADWLDAMRRGDLDTMAARLAPDIVHQGIKPEWICRNRQEVIEMVSERVGRVPPVEALELIAAGDHVVMSVRGVGIGPPTDDSGETHGQATIVFTLRDGKIVRMHDYLHRADALEAAAASVAWD
jgi:ketosteroid isomerase-like protein